MKKLHLFYLIGILVTLGVSIGFTPILPDVVQEDDRKQESLEAASLEAASLEAVSLEAFDQMMKVISHKRCVNCHPADNIPRQGEDSHPHLFGVQRGEDGHGVAGLQCNTCHQKENNEYSGVPGAPHWHLAPKSMGWQGLSRVEIARAMTDKTKNGGRSIQEIETHLTEDPLVLWVFEPGVNHEGIPREKPPLSKEDYIAAVKKWVDTGAKIPEE